MGLRSLLEFEFKKNIDLENKRIGFGSYGSGSSAMVFSGVIQSTYKEIVKDMNLEKEIGTRSKLDMQEYIRLHSNEGKMNEPISNSNNEFVLVKIGGNTADKAGLREYVFSN
jgi:hydroxymethylglutaryl-CoA synthase